MPESMGFLLSDASRLLRKRFDERARVIGATRAQWQALTKLSRHEGINQGGLADMLEVEPITLCRMIDRLESKGLLRRNRRPDDRRVVYVELTEEGHRAFPRMRLVAMGVVNRFLRGFSQAEARQLESYLSRMLENAA